VTGASEVHSRTETERGEALVASCIMYIFFKKIIMGPFNNQLTFSRVLRGLSQRIYRTCFIGTSVAVSYHWSIMIL
jgi:hypothetical protein